MRIRNVLKCQSILCFFSFSLNVLCNICVLAIFLLYVFVINKMVCLCLSNKIGCYKLCMKFLTGTGSVVLLVEHDLIHSIGFICVRKEMKEREKTKECGEFLDFQEFQSLYNKQGDKPNKNDGILRFYRDYYHTTPTDNKNTTDKNPIILKQRQDSHSFQLAGMKRARKRRGWTQGSNQTLVLIGEK